jgi:hypothetical protein
MTRLSLLTRSGNSERPGPRVSANEQAMAAAVYGNAAYSAADKAKLDAIEAGADATDTANVSAAGAVMASGLVSGSVTLDNAATTAVVLASIVAASQVFITPSNAAAASLMAGSSSPYVSVSAGVGFTINTADAGSTAGTETFFYLVRI